MIKFCILKLIETSKTNLELLNDEMHLEFKCIKNENNQLSCSIIMTKKSIRDSKSDYRFFEKRRSSVLEHKKCVLRFAANKLFRTSQK